MTKAKLRKWKMFASVGKSDPENWAPTLFFWGDIARQHAKKYGNKVIPVEVRELPRRKAKRRKG